MFFGVRIRSPPYFNPHCQGVPKGEEKCAYQLAKRHRWLGALFSNHIPNYRNLIISDLAKK